MFEFLQHFEWKIISPCSALGLTFWSCFVRKLFLMLLWLKFILAYFSFWLSCQVSATGILLAKAVFAVRYQTVCLTKIWGASQLFDSNTAKSWSKILSYGSSRVGFRNWLWQRSTMDRDCPAWPPPLWVQNKKQKTIYYRQEDLGIDVVLSIWYLWFLIMCWRQNV